MTTGVTGTGTATQPTKRRIARPGWYRSASRLLFISVAAWLFLRHLQLLWWSTTQVAPPGTPASAAAAAASGGGALLPGLQQSAAAEEAQPQRPQDGAMDASGRVPRSSAPGLVASPDWQWGGCGSGLYPASVCGPLYCLRSRAQPAVYLDLAHRAFEPVAEPAMVAMCSEAAGGQLGPPYDAATFGGSSSSSGGSFHHLHHHPSNNNQQRQRRQWRPGDVEVSFVLTFKDKPATTIQCILELFRTAREAAAVELVLVDDGSAPPAAAAVRRAAALLTAHFGLRVAHVRNRRSKGFGAANNAGGAAARGHYVALLNNDAVVTPGWLRALLDAAESEGAAAGIVGPAFVNSTGWMMEAGGVVWADGSAGNVGRFNRPAARYFFRRPVDYVSAACLLMPRAVFLEVGGTI
jgi:hypothetical protein